MKRRRLEESPTRLSLQSPWETRLFNLMTPVVKSSLREFHARLVVQAEKCGFATLDLKDRLVRDRLLMFLDSEQCNYTLSLYPDPTAEEILEESDKDQVWPQILPYLKLPALHNLAGCHPKLSKSVHAHLACGHRLVVDQETLNQYPMEVYKDLFSTYGSSATNVEFHGLLGYELVFLLPLFPNITQLTLRRVHIGHDNFSIYPQLLDKLILIETKTSWGCCEWISKLAHLEVLHLERVGEFMGYQRKKLRSLTLINQWFSDFSFDFYFPMVEDLTIDYWSSISDECLRGLEHLKSLRILGNVELFEMQKIQALGLTTVRVGDVVKPPEESNLMLRLNEDCMLHLRSFLSDKDWIALKGLHPAWKRLGICCFEIDREYLAKVELADRENQYRHHGPQVAKLRMYPRMPAGEFPVAIPHFTHLTELEMHINTQVAKLLPTVDLRGLVVLKLTFSIKTINWERLFKTLNPTLRTLHLSYDDRGMPHQSGCPGLSELRQVQHVTLNNLILAWDFIEFLCLNKESLKSMDLSKVKIQFSVGFVDPMCYALGKLVHLKKLSMSNVGVVNISSGSLPALEELSIRNDEGDENRFMVDKFLLNLDGSQLRHLYVGGKDIPLGAVVWKKIPNLNVLSLFGSEEYCLIPDIFVLRQLRALKMTLKEDQILTLVKGLPELIIIKLSAGKWPKDPTGTTIAQVREYLRQCGRKLKLNSFLLK